jgi:hypothetical protein
MIGTRPREKDNEIIELKLHFESFLCTERFCEIILLDVEFCTHEHFYFNIKIEMKIGFL